ncbi:hypothetical protein ACFV9C_06600 [Kribbella sp. NPDC059898]|uniref:hypothetical protein n=1 Tax=Kribbella sp. NPDC059898 TaxID=3346995 RepID=UPI0036562190
MTYDVFCIRDLGESGHEAMYPTLDNVGQLRTEPLDGDRRQHLVAHALSVREAGGGSVFSLGDVRADVYITEARVTLVCSKYDKGGGWVGSPGTALALNAVSKIRAARRSKNKALVGHIRFPWLASVGFSPKQGWLDEEVLRFVVRDGTEEPSRLLVVDLNLPKELDSGAIARAVMLRAVAYRTTHEELADDELAGFRALADAPDPPRRQARSFALYSMPTSWNATPATAYPRPA